MITAKKVLGEDPSTPFQTHFFYPIIHINTEKINQNISETKYAAWRASSLQNFMQNIESHDLSPLLNPRTNPSPFFCFCFLKKIVADENKKSVLV